MWLIFLDLVEKILVFRTLMQCFRLTLCSATEDVWEGYAGGVPWTWSQYSIQFPQCRLWPHLQETSCKPDVVCHKLLSSCWRRLKILLEREDNIFNAVPGQQLNNVITSHAGSWSSHLLGQNNSDGDWHPTDTANHFQPFRLNVIFRSSISYRLSQSPTALALWTNEGSMVCLLEGWWWELEVRYGLVWEGFQCDLWSSETLGFQ